MIPLLVGPALAQTASRPPLSVTATPAEPTVPPDPAFEASKQAYEKLPESDRKAVQDALVWAGVYAGAVDGTFGKRTRDALIAFETREKLNADAVVDAGELARLKASARKAREAVRFSTVTDPGTGVRLGLPLKTLTKHTSGTTRTHYQSADGTVTVDIQVTPESETDLARMFETTKAGTADRKVTYKASKPDWFVVSGESGDKRFYTRVARGAGPSGGELRGFDLVYPAAMLPDFERISLAIANSFEPFPTGPNAEAKAPSAPPPAAGPVAAARALATGVMVAPGRLLSVLPERCAAPSLGKAALTTILADPASGLALLGASDAAGAGLPLGAAAPSNGAALLVIGYAADKGGPTLGVSPGEGFVRSPEGKPAEARVLAALQDDASGSAVFDRSGALVGIVAREALAPRLVAGIAPQASHPVIGAPDLARFLAAAKVEPASGTAAAADRTAGDIVAAARPGIVAITCAR